jgi:hypothetical protein
MIAAVERAHNLLNRTVIALDASGVRYGVAGGNAVAAWVSRVDATAIRNCPDVDVVLSRGDFDPAALALTGAGLLHRLLGDAHHFLDGPDGRIRDGVHVHFAGEMTKPDDVALSPTLDETEDGKVHWNPRFRIVSLDALVRMLLTSHKLVDRVLLRDLIDVELIDATWPAKFHPVLGERLQALLDNPDGQPTVEFARPGNCRPAGTPSYHRERFMNPERHWNRMKTAFKERNFKAFLRLVLLMFRQAERMNRETERMHPSSSDGGLTVFLVLVSGGGCLIAIFFEKVWLWTFLGIVVLYWCFIRMPRRVRRIRDENRDTSLQGGAPLRNEPLR